MINSKLNKILICGGNSFVGSCFIDYLFEKTKYIIVVCNRNKPHKVINSERLIYEKADLLDENSLEKIFKKHLPNKVFHLAAITRLKSGEDNPKLTIKTNFFGTKLIADLSVKYKVKSFLFVSSNMARNPISVIGLSKYLSEVYLRNLKSEITQIITLRLPNVPDSPGSVTPLFKRQILNGGPITITHPDMERRFVSNIEASELLLKCLEISESSMVFVITKENTKITELAKEMILASGKHIDIKFIGMKPGEKLIEEKYEDHEIIKTANSTISILKNDWSDKTVNNALKQIKLKVEDESFKTLINKLELSLHQ